MTHDCREKWVMAALVTGFVILGFALGSVLFGCAGVDGTAMRWAPTEAQKQAADLTVRDTQALKPHVPAIAEPIRSEAERAARATQAYVGLPETPLDAAVASEVSVPDPVKETTLSDAEQASARPKPTVVDTTNTGFGILEALLGTIGGVGGMGLVVRSVRKKLAESQALSQQLNREVRVGGVEIDAQKLAVNELVSQVQEIKDWAANGVNPTIETAVAAIADILKEQSFETQKIVSKARLNAGRNSEGDAQ